MAPVNLRDMLMPAVETAARRACVPVAIHLDHGANVEPALERLRSLHPQPLPDKMAAFVISGGRAGGFKRLFMTHLSLQERIAALKAQGWH
jgi:Zn-dependent protease with chaperone function